MIVGANGAVYRIVLDHRTEDLYVDKGKLCNDLFENDFAWIQLCIYGISYCVFGTGGMTVLTSRFCGTLKVLQVQHLIQIIYGFVKHTNSNIFIGSTFHADR